MQIADPVGHPLRIGVEAEQAAGRAAERIVQMEMPGHRAEGTHGVGERSPRKPLIR